VFPVEEGGCATMLSHLPHIRFRFVESSMYVEEERKSALGELLQSVPIAKTMEEEEYR